MPLKNLVCYRTLVTDLSPLRGMPLESLHSAHNAVADLEPQRGLALRSLYIQESLAPSLDAIKGMPLEALWCDVRHYQPEDVQLIKNLLLKWINGKTSEEFWRAFQLERQAIDDFAIKTAELPLQQRVAAVRSELNPRPALEDLKLAFVLKDDIVTGVTLLLTKELHDLTPLRAFKDLKSVTISGGIDKQDLSPLRGLPVTTLNIPDVMVPKNALLMQDVESRRSG